MYLPHNQIKTLKYRKYYNSYLKKLIITKLIFIIQYIYHLDS